MPITFLPDGSIRVDTIEEAEALANSKFLKARRLPPTLQATEASTRAETEPAIKANGTNERWSRFVALVRGAEKQWLLLTALKERGRVDLDAARELLGVADNKAVAGVSSGLVKNAKKADLESGDVLRRVFRKDARDRTLGYRAGPMLQKEVLAQ